MKKSQVIFNLSDIIKEYRNCRATSNVELAKILVERLTELGMKPPETKTLLQGPMPGDTIEVSLNIWENE